MYKFIHFGFAWIFWELYYTLPIICKHLSLYCLKKIPWSSFFNGHVHRSKFHFDGCFITNGPRPWNSLLEDVRLATTLSSFRNMLKAYLFFVRPILHNVSSLPLWMLVDALGPVFGQRFLENIIYCSLEAYHAHKN